VVASRPARAVLGVMKSSTGCGLGPGESYGLCRESSSKVSERRGFFLTLPTLKRDNRGLTQVSPKHRTPHSFCRSIAWIVIVALLWPIAVSAQAPAPAPAPAPVPGARFDAITGVALPGQQRFVVPPDYLLGPGDLVEVQITGRLDVQRQSLVIDVAGNINFPPLGNI